MTFSSITKFSIRFFAVGCSVLLSAFCFYATLVSPEVPALNLLALLLPYLVIANFLFGFLTSLKRSKLVIFPLFSLVFWLFSLGPFIVLTFEDHEDTVDNVSVLSYNVRDFGGYYRKLYPDLASRIINFVIDEDADIVCFQEISRSRLFRDKMKVYPYMFRYPDDGSKRYSPLTIYSNYPMLSRGSLDFPDSYNNAIYADLLIDRDTLRVYNVHLQSLRFRPGSIKSESPLQILKRLGKTISIQKSQADKIYEHASSSPYPFIICGDFNNTQYSKVYLKLKTGMIDTFMEKGNGLGTTLLFKFLPFRIDYILVDPDFEVTAHENFDVEYSDHFPIKASFRIKPQ